MINLKAMAGGAMIAAVAASGVAAQTFTAFGETQGWNVYTNTSDKTCVMEKNEGNGIIVQMGVNKKKTMGYIGVFTQDPTNISKGDKNELVIDFGGSDVFIAQSTGMKGNITPGFSGAYIKANNPNFIADVANKQTLKAIDHNRMFSLDLTGTKAAMAMARECIAAQE